MDGEVTMNLKEEAKKPVKQSLYTSIVCLILSLSLLMFGLWKFNYVVIVFSTALLAISIKFIIKFRRCLSIITSGEIREFEIIDHVTHLGSKGIIYYSPVVKDVVTQDVIEVTSSRSTFKSLIGAKILGFAKDKKYHFMMTLDKIVVRRDQLG